MIPPATIENTGVHVITDTTAVTTSGPLTCEGVAFRRAKAGKFNGGVAAFSSSEMFKSPAPEKPLAKDWSHYLNEESKLRKFTVLKGLARHMTTPGMISLGGGLPSSEYFPFEYLDVKVPAIGHFSEEETKKTGKIMRIGKHDIREGKSTFDLSVALNYGQSSGASQMIRWVTEHTEIVHNPPYRNWECTLSTGNTSSLDMVFRMFLERGDYIIAEEFTFATAVETSHPMGCKFLGIKMDKEGMLPDVMDEVLENWDPAAHGGARKPFLVYTIPTGQNPTGSTQGAERRREIYKVAQKHDLILIEDEPYYFLQMQPYTGVDAPPAPLPKTHEEFLGSLIPSFLSMDVDGRVIRLDSFSKVLAPGSRCGWIVASPQICNRMQRHGEVSTQHPSGMSQVILHRLLDEEWGHGHYLDWLFHLRIQYTERRNVMLKACEDYLPKDVATWTPPTAGMFQWINLDPSKHPDFGKRTIASIEEEVFKAAVDQCVLITPGSYFVTEEMILDTIFFRATFAAAESDAMIEAVRRFGVAIRQAFRIEN